MNEELANYQNELSMMEQDIADRTETDYGLAHDHPDGSLQHAIAKTAEDGAERAIAYVRIAGTMLEAFAIGVPSESLHDYLDEYYAIKRKHLDAKEEVNEIFQLQLRLGDINKICGDEEVEPAAIGEVGVA